MQPEAPKKLGLIGNWEATYNARVPTCVYSRLLTGYPQVPDSPELKLKGISQGQAYSMEFPELQTFRDLFKPIVGPFCHTHFTGFVKLKFPKIIRYPQPGQVPREQSPFCTIDSGAYQLSFKSNWNGLSFAEAEEIWTLGICAREWLIDIAKNIPDAKVHPGQSENSPWPLFSCPKEFFVDILRKIYAKTTDIVPTWAQSVDEMDQFLSTCTTFHTIETIKGSKGIYAPGLDSFNRLYCMYAMQPEYKSEAMNLRHFMRQIVVPEKQTDIISGEKGIITPTLWDPHKPYDALRKQTKFTMTPPWLTWDEDICSFVGVVGVLGRDCPFMSFNCVIRAYTIEDHPKGASFETTVEASVALHLRIPEYKKRGPVPEILETDLVAEEADNLWETKSDSYPESELMRSLGNDIYIAKKSDTKEYSIPNVLPVNPPDAIGIYGGTHPTFKQRKIVHKKEGVISLRWDPEQWLSVIVRVESPKEKLGWEPDRPDEPGLFNPMSMNDGSRHINRNRPTDHPLGYEKNPRRSSHEAVTMLMGDKEEEVEYVC